MQKRSAFFLLALLLASCTDEPPPVIHNFPPLHYEYLSKLRLNVGTIDIQDRSHPLNANDIAALSPAVPAQALERMARDRLFAAGLTGSATFVIDQAGIVQGPGGTLDGRLAVHLDITKPDGTPGGYASAEVLRQHIPGSDPEDQSVELYDLTRQMMDAMNVEIEYQLKRSLSALLVSRPQPPAPVEAQPLAAPTAQPLPPPTEAAPPAEPPPPPANGYVDPEAPPPPPQMSPPPGVLQLPPGVPQ